MSTIYKEALFMRFTIRMTVEDALSGAHTEDCYDDICELVKKEYITKQLDNISHATIKQELKEYGAWDEVELADEGMNYMCIVWIAACMIKEEL